MENDNSGIISKIGDGENAVPNRVQYSNQGYLAAPLLDTYFDTEPEAIFLLDAELKVLSLNRSAQRLLSEAETLIVKEGFLEVVDPKLEPMLLNLVRRAKLADGAYVFDVLGGHRRQQLTVKARKIPQGDGTTVVVSLTARIVAGLSLDRMDGIARQFGLTRTETEVLVEMAAGKLPQDAADAMGLKFQTIKSHLKKIHPKMSVNHRGELMELLSRYFV